MSNAPIPSGFTSLLDYAVAMMDYGDDPVERMYNRDRASQDLARLRAVEKAVRMASEAWGRDSRTGPPYLFHAMVALTAALEAKP